MNRQMMERCFSALLVLLGCYVLRTALNMDVMTEDVPGPGFIPSGLGGLLIFFGSWVFTLAGKCENTVVCNFKNFTSIIIVTIAASLTVIFAEKVGLLVMLGLLAGFLAWYAGANIFKSLITSVSVCVTFYLIFVAFLSSNFPKGFLGF